MLNNFLKTNNMREFSYNPRKTEDLLKTVEEKQTVNSYVSGYLDFVMIYPDIEAFQLVEFLKYCNKLSENEGIDNRFC